MKRAHPHQRQHQHAGPKMRWSEGSHAGRMQQQGRGFDEDDGAYDYMDDDLGPLSLGGGSLSTAAADHSSSRESRLGNDALVSRLGEKKGLDFELLEMQRKGAKVVDVLMGEKLAQERLEAKIRDLFPPIDPRPVQGWGLQLSVSKTSDPIPLYDKVEPWESATDNRGQRSVIPKHEIEIILEAIRSSSSITKSSIVVGERNAPNYGEENAPSTKLMREVQEISDDEDDVEVPTLAPSKLPENQPAPDDEEDFDMFGGPISGTASEEAPKTPVTVTTSDLSHLGLDELRTVLLKIDNALRLIENAG